eukprot:3251024-Prymnesium_polylepis.2
MEEVTQPLTGVPGPQISRIAKVTAEPSPGVRAHPGISSGSYRSKIALRGQYTAAAAAAAAGMVTTHPITIFLSMLKSGFAFSMPHSCSANETPMRDPTRQCDVETGRPATEEPSTATAAPICVAKERWGMSTVIFEATVDIVRDPISKMPATNPAVPPTTARNGTSGVAST